MSVTPPATVTELVRRLDEAVTGDDVSCCRNVKRVLSEFISAGGLTLDPAYLAPAPDRYARRLLHRDPRGRYTVIVMVWGEGQGTPLHDHAGIWCVECVYEGRIEVTSYAVRGGDPETGVVQFSEESVVRAGAGEAGALIPPFEYHVLRNGGGGRAVTIHVYGGEMNHCHVFEPVDGGWQRRYRELSYTPL